MSGIRIDYGGVALGAKEAFNPSTQDKADFVNLSDLKRNDIDFSNYENPCDLYSVFLDGNALPLPENTEGKNIGWWSEQISQENGTFENPIVLTLEASDLYTSSGITLTFDAYNSTYATDINIKWYNGSELIENVDFAPDSAYYFCSQKVEFFNRVKITFKKINMPYNRLKLRSIEYGAGITFYGDELKNAKIIQEIDPLSSQISINTCDFTLISKRDIEFAFEERQPITTYFDDKLIATSFIKKSTRKSKDVWSIQSEDYVGLLDNISFYGGIYKQKKASDLLIEIFETANVPYQFYGSEWQTETVTGYIPYTTCRNALMQVAFAVGLIVDTSNSAAIKVYQIDEEIKQTIPLSRILNGQNFEDETRISMVEVAYHTYTQIQDEIVAYDAEESGTGNNIFVLFNNPLHGLQIENGTIVNQGANYATINAGSGCILRGKKYEHTIATKNKVNPVVLANDTENIVSVKDATLLSIRNVDKVLNRCYNYYTTTGFVNLKIVEGKHEVVVEGSATKYGNGMYSEFKYGEGSTEIIYDEKTNVGDTIEFETAYLSDMHGIITKQTFNLNGNIIIKDSRVKRRE